ncbi:MAG: ComEC/Rec2 family competence protein [Opitutaceae bacterium]
MQGDDEHLRAPLLWILGPYVAGALAACIWQDGARPGLLLIGAPLVAIVALRAAAREDGPGARMWMGAIAAASLLAGAGWMQAALFTPARWKTLPPRETTMVVRLERVFSPTEGIEKRSCIGKVVTAPELISDIVGQRVFFAILPPPEDVLIRTTEMRVEGVLEPLLGRDPPAGSFDAFLFSSGVRFRLARATIEEIAHLAEPMPRLWHGIGAQLERILRHGIPDTHPASQAYVAMFLGRKSELSVAQREAFLRSGTMHLFAISGMHIGIIALCLHTVLALARLRSWPAFVIGLVLLTVFVESTGGTPSARRALFMVAVMWAGQALRRPANPLAALCGSALAVLLVDPLALLSASFQLSYAVVGAILLYGVPLSNRGLARWKPFAMLTPDELRWWRHGIRLAGRGLIKLLAVSLAATAVSLPLGVAVFGMGSPGAILSNVMVLPISGLAVVGGFAAIVCGAVGLLPLASLFNHAASLVLWLIAWMADVASRLPGMFFNGRFPSAWVATAVVLTLIGVCIAGYATRWRRPRGMLLAPPVLVAVALFFLVTPEPQTVETAAMKSAYELAMERLQKSDPDASPKLSDEQKAQLAEIDRVYQGKIAEREIFLNKRLAEASASATQPEEIEQIRKQITSERARLEEDREDAKNRVRRGG